MPGVRNVRLRLLCLLCCLLKLPSCLEFFYFGLPTTHRRLSVVYTWYVVVRMRYHMNMRILRPRCQVPVLFYSLLFHTYFLFIRRNVSSQQFLFEVCDCCMYDSFQLICVLSFVFICFPPEVIFRSSYWSLSCDHGLHCSDDELM